jgi:hypothetical protein
MTVYDKEDNSKVKCSRISTQVARSSLDWKWDPSIASDMRHIDNAETFSYFLSHRYKQEFKTY